MESMQITPQLLQVKKKLDEPGVSLAQLVELKSQNAPKNPQEGGIISLSENNQYTTEFQPVVGTSLVFEVELSDSSGSEDEIPKSQNIF